MSWLGGSLSSLTGQLSNLTKDILTEGTEEVSDHVTELRLAQDRLKELDTVCVSQKVENDRLKLLVREWEEKAESSELQINSISREYRTLLEEKDKEIKALKQQQHEHQELKSAFLDSEDQGPASIGFTNDGFESIGLVSDELDFGDNIAMQHDINRLRGNLQKAQAECQHWKKLAEQNSPSTESQASEVPESNEALLQQLKGLQQQLDYEKDQRQFEISSLQDAHNHKISTIRKKHKDEVAELKQKIHELEWTSEGWDTPQASDSSSLKLQLESLQEELTTMKVERDEHLQTIAKLNETIEEQKSELSVKHAQNLHLDNQLKVAREKIDGLLMDHDQVGRDLYDTKQRLLDQLDANHADTLEVLSDLRQIRQHMDTSSIDRRHKLLTEKDMLVNEIISSGEKGKDLEAYIEELECERAKLKEDAEKMVIDMGDKEHQKLTGGIIDSLEKENVLLKQRNVSLQEQVTLLEKAVLNVSRERSLKQQSDSESVQGDSSKQAADDVMSDTTSITSDLSELSRRNCELDEHVSSLRRQITRYETDIEQFELLKEDWQNEKDALEQVLMQLRSQMREKENSLNIAEAQKGLLAVEKHETNSSPLPDLLDDSSNEIAEEMVKLDKKIEMLADCNAQLEEERDKLRKEKVQLEKEVSDLKMERKPEEPVKETDPTPTDWNKLLEEKEEELKLIMSEKEDLENNLKEVPELKLKLEEKRKELDLLLMSQVPEAPSDEVLALDKEIDELKRKLRGKNEEIVNITLEKEEMMSSLEELDNQHQEEMGHIIKIKEQLSKSNEELTNKLKASESEIQGLKSENEALRSQQMMNQSDESASSNELNHQIAELKEDNQSLREQLEVNAKQIKQLQADLTSREDKLNELNVKLVSSAESLNDLHMDKQELQDKVNKLKEDKSELSRKLKVAREKESELIKKESVDNTDSNVSVEYIDRLQKENSELTEKCSNFSEMVDSKTLELNELKTQLNSRDDDLKQLRNALTDKDNEIEKFNLTVALKDSSVLNLETELSSVKTDCDKLNDECKKKHEECESFSRQLHALEHELNASKTAERETENKALLEQVEVLNSEVEISNENLSIRSKEVEELTTEIKRVKDLLDDTTGRLHDKSEECNKLSEEVESYKVRLKDIEDVKTNRGQADDISATEESTVAEKDPLLYKLETELLSVKTDCEKLSEECRKKHEECESFSRQLHAMEHELHSSNETVKEQEVENSTLSSQVEILNNELTIFKQNLSMRSDELDTLSTELRRVKNSLEETADKLHVKNEECKQLSEEVELYKAKLEELKEVQENHVNAEYLSATGELWLVKEELANKTKEWERIYKDVIAKDEEIKFLKSKEEKYKKELEEFEEKLNENKQSSKKEMSEKQLSGQFQDTELQREVRAVSETMKENEIATQELTSLKGIVNNMQQENMILENEIKIIKAENEKVLSDSKAEKDALNTRIQELELSLRTLKSEEQVTMNENTNLRNESSKLQEHVQKLEAEVERYKQAVIDFQGDLKDLDQEKSSLSISLQQLQERTNSQETTITNLQQESVQKDNEISNSQHKLNKALSLMNEDQLQKLDGDSSSKIIVTRGFHDNGSGDLIEVQETMQTAKKVGGLGIERIPSYEGEKDYDKHDIVIEIEKLQDQLKEKDNVISEMQRNNTFLLKMLDTRSKSSSGESSVVEIHKMENEMRSMKMEKEQMMDVLTEKSRENSNLKAELQRLMNVVAAEKSALQKLQKDNQQLVQNSVDKDGQRLDDMQKEVVQNLSRMIRDKDLEIESLSQKNQTLLSVLQESSNEGTEIKTLLQDKENLAKQLATLQGEREQMITYLNQKHQESLAYHTEVQRLTAFVASETQNHERIKMEYETLVPQFEEKKQVLLKCQSDLINYKQKYQELEVKYGQLIQQSDSGESVDKALYESKIKEIETLQTRINELMEHMKEKENKIQVLHQTVSELEQNFRSVDHEKAGYKKQVDNFTFQLHGLQSESGELKADISLLQQQKQAALAECQMLTEANKKLSLQLQDSEFEVKSLQEKTSSLTAIIQEGKGEKVGVEQFTQDNEVTQNRIRQLQQERDQTAMALQQSQQDNLGLRQEIQTLKEKEGKLNRELDRLRQHLIQIEDGYTREALAAEEREKDLRTRLTEAEEQAYSSSSAMETTSQQTSQKMESLKQQLEFVSQQRDQAYLQISTLQEQNQTFSVSLANLQMVLEQFQEEKDQMVADETEKYVKQIKDLRSQNKSLEENLNYTKEQLDEVSDGLEAASRLSEQLDRKEEAIDALREEVQIRESSLKVVEEELKSLKSRNDDRVDKLVIKNLFLGYFTTPANKRGEVLRAIGGVLQFNQEDFSKIDNVNSGGGWMSGILKFGGTPTQKTPPTTPARRSTISTPVSRGSSTFSEMFVRFLERESSPPPPTVRLPAEEMVRDVQKQKESNKPAYNPFTAPRHVAVPLQTSTHTSSPHSDHILMSSSVPSSYSLTTFAVPSESSATPPGSGRNTPASTTSGAILKDVLNR